MNSHTTFIIFGPSTSLVRMTEKIFTDYPPHFLHSRIFESSKIKFEIAVYEEYNKHINSSITLTCIFESSSNKNKILLKKTGDRMGFRGGAVSDDQNIEEIIKGSIIDYSKRYGLTVQEERVSDTIEEE